MPDKTYKMIELVGVSEESIQQATGRFSGASSDSTGTPRDHEPHGVRVIQSER